MKEITLKLTDEEMKALEECAYIMGRNVDQQAVNIVRKSMIDQAYLKPNVNESKSGKKSIRLDEVLGNEAE